MSQIDRHTDKQPDQTFNTPLLRRGLKIIKITKII